MPALGYKIHKENLTADMKINLVGVALGDALIDPQNVSTHNYAGIHVQYNYVLAIFCVVRLNVGILSSCTILGSPTQSRPYTLNKRPIALWH